MVLTNAEILELEAEMDRIEEAMAKNEAHEKEWYRIKGDTEIHKKFDDEMRRIFIEADIINLKHLNELIKKIRKAIVEEDAATSSK